LAKTTAQLKEHRFHSRPRTASKSTVIIDTTRNLVTIRTGKGHSISYPSSEVKRLALLVEKAEQQQIVAALLTSLDSEH
jgi:hypothetical protein